MHRIIDSDIVKGFGEGIGYFAQINVIGHSFGRGDDTVVVSVNVDFNGIKASIGYY